MRRTVPKQGLSQKAASTTGFLFYMFWEESRTPLNHPQSTPDTHHVAPRAPSVVRVYVRGRLRKMAHLGLLPTTGGAGDGEEKSLWG